MIKNLDLVMKIDETLNTSKCHGGLLGIIGFVGMEKYHTGGSIVLDGIKYYVSKEPFKGYSDYHMVLPEQESVIYSYYRFNNEEMSIIFKTTKLV